LRSLHLKNFVVALDVIKFGKQFIALLFFGYQGPFSGLASFHKVAVPGSQILIVGVELVKLILLSGQPKLKASQFFFERLKSLSMDHLDKARPHLANYFSDLLKRQAKFSLMKEQMLVHGLHPASWHRAMVSPMTWMLHGIERVCLCQISSALLRDEDTDASSCSHNNDATGRVWVFDDALQAPIGVEDLAVLGGVGVCTFIIYDDGRV
jgi:hypothetical protein